MTPLAELDGLRVRFGAGLGAVEAVRGYSFAPATRGGVAVQAVAELPFTFSLAQ